MILTIFTEPTQIPPLSKSATWLLACLAHCDCKMKGPFHVSLYYLTAVKITARIIRMWLTWFHLRSKIHDANEILAVSPLKGLQYLFSRSWSFAWISPECQSDNNYSNTFTQYNDLKIHLYISNYEDNQEHIFPKNEFTFHARNHGSQVKF